MTVSYTVSEILSPVCKLTDYVTTLKRTSFERSSRSSSSDDRCNSSVGDIIYAVFFKILVPDRCPVTEMTCLLLVAAVRVWDAISFPFCCDGVFVDVCGWFY